MNKKLYLFLALFFSLSLFFVSCDDDDDNGVDQEWKSYNEKLFKEVENNKEYFPLESGTKNGTIWYKNTDVITKTIAEKDTKITEHGKPFVSDSVVVRYIGWCYRVDGTKYTFDSTEGNANKQNGVGFRITKTIPGWIDMLTYMTVNEEVEVCIPYQLGYGASGNSAIPAYTTLWFDIKLLKIIPVNPDEWH